MSRRCLPVTPWPRLCMVGPSLGWWRRSTSLWLRRCSYSSENNSNHHAVGLLLCFTINFLLCTLYVMQDELHRSSKSSSLIGLLDIYGFEVLQHNRYELHLFPFFCHNLILLVNTPCTRSKNNYRETIELLH